MRSKYISLTNNSEEWEAFFKEHISIKILNGIPGDDIFKKLSNTVINIAIWSFLKNEIFPLEPFSIKSDFEINSFKFKNVEENSITKFFVNNNHTLSYFFTKSKEDIFCYQISDEITKIDLNTFYDNLRIPSNELGNIKKVYKNNIENTLIKNDNINYIYFFPINSFTKKGVSSLLVINSKGQLETKLIQDVLITIIKGVLLPYQMEEIDLIRENHAIKSAISAIQSRNESHNIGSHVISSLINGLFKPTDMQVLLKYLQERMDYSAQVSVDIPKWTANTWLVSQLLKDFAKQNLLLNNIVKSEKIDRIGWDTHTFDIKLRIESEKENFKSIFSELDDLENQDLQLAIPGGITGNQAFYNILENIIRNIAKHGFSKLSAQNKKDIVIFLDLMSGNNSNYELYISDNLTTETQKVCKEDFEERLYSGFIDESTGELVYKNWGTAEIKIGAGYLNQKEYTEIGGSDIENKIKKYIELVHLDDNRNVVENNSQPDEGNAQNKFIAYKISLPKPRKILIFDPSVGKNSVSNGCAILKELNGDEIIAYDFVILKEDVDDNIRKKLPYRVIPIEDIRNGDEGLFNALNSFEEENKTEIYNQLYYFWLNKKYLNALNGENVNLLIDLSVYGLKDKKHFNELQMLKFILKDPYFTNKGIIQKINSFINFHKKELTYSDYVNFILDETNYDIQNKFKNNSALCSQIYDSQNITEIHCGLTNDEICQLNKKLGAKIQLANSSEKEQENIICFQRHAETDKKDKLYLEALSGSQSYFGRLSSLDVNLVYGLVESALTKICIIDERVFDFQEQMNYKNTFNNLNIVVHRDWSSLNHDNLLGSDFEEYILIIHQSILSAKEEKILKKKFLRIYTTSGRGTPEKKFAKDKNYDDIKFIPFANIQHALLKPYPEKYILVQNLFKI